MGARKTVRKVTRGGSVDVGRLGAETVTVKVSGRSTVARVLDLAGFDYSEERIMVNGSPATPRTAVKSGDLVLILSPKQAGRN